MNQNVQSFTGVTQATMTASRIESVNDPELNKSLFSFYERLIVPFQEIENLYNNIFTAEQNIDYIKFEKKQILISIFKKLIKNLLIFQGISLALAVLQTIIFRTDITEVVEKLLNLPQGFLSWLYVIIPVPTAVIFTVLVTIFKIRKRNNNIAELEQSIANDNASINERLPFIQEVSAVIPPNYRYSTALYFFVDAYSNSKVDNLKEAVNLFDTHSYRNQMLQSQQTIIAQLQAIEFNQLVLSEQLQKLNRSVWLSAALF